MTLRVHGRLAVVRRVLLAQPSGLGAISRLSSPRASKPVVLELGRTSRTRCSDPTVPLCERTPSAQTHLSSSLQFLGPLRIQGSFNPLAIFHLRLRQTLFPVLDNHLLHLLGVRRPRWIAGVGPRHGDGRLELHRGAPGWDCDSAAGARKFRDTENQRQVHDPTSGYFVPRNTSLNRFALYAGSAVKIEDSRPQLLLPHGAGTPG